MSQKFDSLDAPKFQNGERYEQSARVTAVEEYTTKHLLNPSRNPYHSALEQIYFNSIKEGLPDISCSTSQAKYLSLQVRIAKAKNVLEVGTLGGYSSSWIATAGPDVHITTIEVDEHHKVVAERNIANAGLSKQIDVLLGPGLEVLPRLKDEIVSGKREKFDFVFIDADKQNNLAYLNLAVDMVKPGTGIFVDNVVRNGKLASEEAAKSDARVRATRELVEKVGEDDRLEAVVLQTVNDKNYDGMLIAVVK